MSNVKTEIADLETQFSKLGQNSGGGNKVGQGNNKAKPPVCANCEANGLSRCNHCRICLGENHMERFCRKPKKLGLSAVEGKTADPIVTPKICNSCGKIDPKETFRRCAQCQTVVYYSRRCQKGKWSSHKVLCNSIKHLAERNAAQVSESYVLYL